MERTVSTTSEDKPHETSGFSGSGAVGNILQDSDDLVIPAPPAVGPHDGNDGSGAPPSASEATAAAVVVAPAQIPPETAGDENAPDEEDEDEYEYEYEDDDDVPFVSGFLESTSQIVTAPRDSESPADGAAASSTKAAAAAAPATIRDDEDNPNNNNDATATTTVSSTATVNNNTATGDANSAKATKWRQPSRQAVNMSLRAEQETTGGKRRLAQDLYRIMNQDTAEAGFSLQPQSEDSMKKWTIKLFQFDQDSNLAKDMKVLGLQHIELEMTFPDQYPFDPPFVRVTRPRFKRQTGFVMNGALCMELLTKSGWSPINDIESVIVSIRSLLVVGDGRLEAAYDIPQSKYADLLKAADAPSNLKRDDEEEDDEDESGKKGGETPNAAKRQKTAASASRSSSVQRLQSNMGSYTASEAQAAYTHLSDYHKKKGWDNSGWWARKG